MVWAEPRPRKGGGLAMTPGELDYYGVNELLGDEERMTRVTVRAFVTREALPVIVACHAREDFPRALIPRMGEVGRGFLVEAGTAGFSTRDIKGKFSLRASITSELVLEDVRVPATAILPDAQGLGGPFSCLNQARYGIVWGALGAARTCYETALRYAQERKQFDRPIAGYQLVQQKLVHMLSEITKGQLLAWRLGRMKDAGTMRPEHVSLAKRANVAAALETARLARDILGANGIVNEYPVIRHMLNLETVSTYEGTHDMHTLIVGRDITGLDAIR